MNQRNSGDNNCVNVFVLWAASYTGATWVSFVLGSHRDVFSLGNIKRALTGLNNPNRICAVHRETCAFWPGFIKHWHPEKNLLLQLAEFTGCKNIVVNNPRLQGGWRVLKHPDLNIIPFALKRDLRALAASYMRKNKGIEIEVAVNDYLLNAADNMQADVARENVIVIEHGKASNDPYYLLSKLRMATGMEYDESNLRYWEHEYHVVSSNAGTVGTVKAYQDMDNVHKQSFYNDFVKQLKDKKEAKFDDQRWKKELSEYDRFVIDSVVGDINELLGYERDNFASDISSNYSQQLHKRLLNHNCKKLARRLRQNNNLLFKLLHKFKQKLRAIE